MNKKRTYRIGSEIRKVISELLLNSLKDPRIGEMTSVTDVEVTSDLAFADVYISVLGDDKAKEEALEGFYNAEGFIKKEIGDRLDLRHIPKLNFKIDNTYEQGARIESLLDEINKEDING